jgi:hypothetical protein
MKMHHLLVDCWGSDPSCAWEVSIESMACRVASLQKHFTPRVEWVVWRLTLKSSEANPVEKICSAGPLRNGLAVEWFPCKYQEMTSGLDRFALAASGKPLQKITPQKKHVHWLRVAIDTPSLILAMGGYGTSKSLQPQCPRDPDPEPFQLKCLQRGSSSSLFSMHWLVSHSIPWDSWCAITHFQSISVCCCWMSFTSDSQI